MAIKTMAQKLVCAVEAHHNDAGYVSAGGLALMHATLADKRIGLLKMYDSTSDVLYYINAVFEDGSALSAHNVDQQRHPMTMQTFD